MALFAIPCSPPATTGIATWKQRTQLDGVDYILAFAWLVRDGHFLMHMYDQDESPIALGIKLVPTWDLLRTVIDVRRPPGRIVLWDIANTGADPAFDTLGVQFQLRYYDLAELAFIQSQLGPTTVFGP